MHELETLLGRLKMEHLGYHVESLLELAANAWRCSRNGTGGISAVWSPG